MSTTRISELERTCWDIWDVCTVSRHEQSRGRYITGSAGAPTASYSKHDVRVVEIIDSYGGRVAHLVEKVSLRAFNADAPSEHGEQGQKFVGEGTVPALDCKIVEFGAGALLIARTWSAVVQPPPEDAPASDVVLDHPRRHGAEPAFTDVQDAGSGVVRQAIWQAFGQCSDGATLLMAWRSMMLRSPAGRPAAGSM